MLRGEQLFRRWRRYGLDARWVGDVKRYLCLLRILRSRVRPQTIGYAMPCVKELQHIQRLW